MKLLIALLFAHTAQPTHCLHDCQISPQGEQFIQSFEGYVPFVYKDSAGLDTIGFGHLVKKGEKFETPLLPEQAQELMRKDLKPAISAVNQNVGVNLKQQQFDALASFTYNVGTGSFSSSTLLKRVNAERHTDVPGELVRWNKAAGKVIAGLTRRRLAEGDLYAS